MVTMEFYMGFILLGFFLLLFLLFIIFAAWCADECPHKFKKVAFRQEEDEYRHMRYSVRTYKCTLCEECVEVDTRYEDPYE